MFRSIKRGILRYQCSWQNNYQRKDFSVLNQADIDYFRTILANKNVITDTDHIEPQNTCFTKMVKGNSQLFLLPQSAQEVSAILKYCNSRKLAVVPQGGNTGLVGGSVPVFDEIILNLRNMNQIEKFDQLSSVVTVQAGVILQNLIGFLDKKGFEMPLDLGAKGSCQVGGNASTNAGGKYVIKYGSFRSHILGLEVVLPNGEILDLCSQIFKDNTGYDLKQLFIGSEGTLGIITKINIYCPEADKLRKILVFKTDKYEVILKHLPIFKAILGKDLNALEYMNGASYHAIIQKLHPPIFDKVQLNEHLLFVQSSTDELDSLFQNISDFNDSIMSTTDKEYSKIWKIREDIALAAQAYGKVLAYDISFDVKEWDKMLGHLKQATDTNVMGYGHIGDGNLHVNIILKEGQQFKDKYIFEEVAKKKGSISAEHGVGLHKPKYLHLQKSPQILNIYSQIKKMFDPNGIMNPYKMLPQ